MSDDRIPPLSEDITDLDDLREKVRRRVVDACRGVGPYTLFTDPPFVSLPAVTFVLRCDLAVILIGVAAAVCLAFSLVLAISVAAIGALVYLARWFVHLRVVVPAERCLRECRVLPAVVVQAYTGGFVPPEEEPGGPLFSGVVVFSFDESVTIPQLQSLAAECFKAKTGPDEGPMAALRRMLVTGDEQFVHTSFRLPPSIMGNDRTHATPIMFERSNDLAGGYLSTAAQLILAHPKKPEHVCPVPLVFWESRRALELLDG